MKLNDTLRYDTTGMIVYYEETLFNETGELVVKFFKDGNGRSLSQLKRYFNSIIGKIKFHLVIFDEVITESICGYDIIKFISANDIIIQIRIRRLKRSPPRTKVRFFNPYWLKKHKMRDKLLVRDEVIRLVDLHDHNLAMWDNLMLEK